MNRSLSKKEYCLIDVALFTLLIVVFEIITSKAIVWFKEIYCISLFLSLSLISMRRVGFLSIIPIIASSITYCIINQGELEQYVIYIIGNLFILFSMLYFKLGKEKMKNSYIIILYILTGFFSVEIGRSLVALCFQENFFKVLIGFLGTDSLNCLLALLIILIAKRQDGLFENQIDYLVRINEEKEKENSSLEV